jgi:hypothetical protein
MDDWVNPFAGSAPGSGEIHQHGQCGFEHLGVEILFVDVIYFGHKISFSIDLIMVIALLSNVGFVSILQRIYVRFATKAL